MPLTRRALVTLTLLIIAVCSLYAAPTDEDSLNVRKVYNIEGIRVVGESAVKKIGNLEIKELAPDAVNTEVTIGNMLKDMSGVFLTERGKGESVVRLRGFQDRHIRVFVDGMPISNGYFGNYDLHLMSGNNVSQIHLIKGPVSHQYGFNTMGGVLNIITDDFKEKNTFKTKLLYSSHNKAQASLNGSYAFGRSQLYLSSSYLNAQGPVLPKTIKPFDKGALVKGGERRTNSSREQYAINMRFITDILGLHTFSFASGYSYMPIKENPPSIYIHDDNRFSKVKDWEKITASLSAKSTLPADIDLTASTYYDLSEDTYVNYTNEKYDKIGWESLIRNSTLGAHMNATHTLTESFNNDLGVRFETKGYERTGGPGYENKWVDNTQSMLKFHHNALYQHDDNKFSWTLGNALSSYIHSQIDNYVWYWEPQTGTSYHIGNKTVSLAYGLSNQFPTMRELFSSTSGNPGLKPEKAHKYETSFKTPIAIKRFNATLNASAYYNRVNDLIDRDRRIYYNIEKMSTYGGELNLNFSILSKLNHDYEFSYIRLDKDNSSMKLTEYPPRKLRFTHHLKILDNLNADFTTQWYDESLSYYGENDFYYLPSYWIHDFGIKYFFRKIGATLNVTNLFDSYYEPQYGFPAPGREITLLLEIPLM